MKKFLLIGLIISITIPAFSQFMFKGIGGGISLGSQAGYGSGGNSMGVGININGVAQITDKIDADAVLVYFFPESYDAVVGEYKFNLITLSFDGRYNFYDMDKVKAYGLAGLNFSIVKFDAPEIFGIDISDTDTNIGLNIGGGGSYELTETLDATAQIGYTISDFDQLFINLGVLYKF